MYNVIDKRFTKTIALRYSKQRLDNDAQNIDYDDTQYKTGKMAMKLSQKLTLILGVSALGACQPVAVAPPIAQPPVVIAPPPIPSMPLPPLSSAAGLTIPSLDIDGTRSSPNKGLGPEETLWHLRSSYNVAALTCQGPVWGRIASDYNAFLQKHDNRLRIANRAIEALYQNDNSGRAGRRARDTHITSLYNYFSLPPVKSRFCNEMLIYSSELSTIDSADLRLYAQVKLPEIDTIFTDFYDDYEAYQIALADWQAQYGSP